MAGRRISQTFRRRGDYAHPCLHQGYFDEKCVREIKLNKNQERKKREVAFHSICGASSRFVSLFFVFFIASTFSPLFPVVIQFMYMIPGFYLSPPFLINPSPRCYRLFDFFSSYVCMYDISPRVPFCLSGYLFSSVLNNSFSLSLSRCFLD